MENVSVRELRQHLSRYLQRVALGERLVVTERRRPVAMLGPLPEDDDLLDLPAPRPAEGPSTSELLDDLRADRV